MSSIFQIRSTGTAALGFEGRVPAGQHWRLMHVTCAFNNAPTTSENFTIEWDADAGPAYDLLWGRFHSAESVERFAERLGVEYFIIGHTPQEAGHTIIGRLIILASEHNHGAFLPIDLSHHYTVEELESKIRKFVSLA